MSPKRCNASHVGWAKQGCCNSRKERLCYNTVQSWCVCVWMTLTDAREVDLRHLHCYHSHCRPATPHPHTSHSRKCVCRVASSRVQNFLSKCQKLPSALNFTSHHPPLHTRFGLIEFCCRFYFIRFLFSPSVLSIFEKGLWVRGRWGFGLTGTYTHTRCL